MPNRQKKPKPKRRAEPLPSPAPAPKRTRTEAPSSTLARAAPANITAVVGASQTGKGMYCKERLTVPHDGVTVVWSWLEATDRYHKFLEGHAAPRTATAVWALAEAISAGERCLV